NGNVVLTGGLTPDNVIFNFVGGSGFNDDPALSFNVGAGGLARGIFLDPNGKISSNASNILGRLFGGGSNNFQFNGGSNITAPISNKSSPTLIASADPITVTLGSTAVTLSDTAVLAGGYSPVGSITFTLTGPGGFVYRQTDPVSGNGSYSASTTLPGAGVVAG